MQTWNSKACPILHVPIEREVPDIPEKPSGTVVGIDRGIRYHAVTYDGKDAASFIYWSKKISWKAQPLE